MHWPIAYEFHNSVPALLSPFLGWVAYCLLFLGYLPVVVVVDEVVMGYDVVLRGYVFADGVTLTTVVAFGFMLIHETKASYPPDLGLVLVRCNLIGWPISILLNPSMGKLHLSD